MKITVLCSYAKRTVIAWIITIFSPVGFFSSCRQSKEIAEGKNVSFSLANFRDKYKIARIDSTKTIYIIYARKDNMLYKIVSLKDSMPCKRIQIGEEHALVLHSIFHREIGGTDLSSIPHVTVTYYGEPVKLEPDSINDIFIAFNMNGLCVQ